MANYGQRAPVAFAYDEVKNMILSIGDKTDRFVLAVCYANGCRVSEVLGVRAEDIELTDEFVYIETPVLKKRKLTTGKGIMKRAPPISRKGEAWLTELILDYAAGKRGSLVPYSKRTIQRRFDQYCDCTSHSFRHTRASHCLKHLGYSMEQVSMYFRLSPRGLTDWILRYGHLSMSDLEKTQREKFGERK